MSKIITVTEMMRTCSDIMGRVYYNGETYDIKRGNNIIARLIPICKKPTLHVKDLNKLFANIPHLYSEDIDNFQNDMLDMKQSTKYGGIDSWD